MESKTNTDLTDYSKQRLITACKDYFDKNDFPVTVKTLTDLLNSSFDETSDVGYTMDGLAVITHSITSVISFLVSISDEVNFLNKSDEPTKN